MKKLAKLLSVPFIAIMVIIGFNPTDADAQFGEIEDTWESSLGDCAGSPTDCLDTLVITLEL